MSKSKAIEDMLADLLSQPTTYVGTSEFRTVRLGPFTPTQLADYMAMPPVPTLTVRHAPSGLWQLVESDGDRKRGAVYADDGTGRPGQLLWTGPVLAADDEVVFPPELERVH